MNLNFKKNIKIIVTLILVLVLFSSCGAGSHIQNKNQTSYFLELVPDNLGNFEITVDVVNYNNSYNEIFSIVQQEDHPQNGGGYKQFKPNLAYGSYSTKKYSITSNTDEALSSSTKASVTINFEDKKIEDVWISEQGSGLNLPDKPEYVTDFSLLIYSHDRSSRNSLKWYPFDTVNSVIVFDFPNKSNVNLLLEIPNELKSYSVIVSLSEQNKNTGEVSQIPFKKIYEGLYSISSTQLVNHDENYTRIDLEMKRSLLSIEKISYVLMIIISLLILFDSSTKRSNSLPLYSIILSILIGFYIDNRPPIEIGMLEIPVIILLFILILPKVKDLIKKERLGLSNYYQSKKHSYKTIK